MYILTNDDGIDAPGIAALAEAVIGEKILVAPKDHFSGCGHQLTTSRPIKVEKRSDIAYAVSGTPADCTRIALKQIDAEINCVISGINAGGNLGVDAYTSGTVAAVREAAMHGYRGIAISHWIKRPLPVDWEKATRYTQTILEILLDKPTPPYSFWNVNLPHLDNNQPEPEIVFCSPSQDPLPVDFRVEGDLYHYQGEYALRQRTPGTDVDVCFSGNIAITMLTV